jgi:mRNA interferase MazF
MPSMTGYDFGQTVLVQFPFTDQIGLKRRPAVVVSSSAYHRRRPDLILLAITSQLGEIPDLLDVLVSDWRAAGLLRPSAIKPAIFTIESSTILRTLGEMTSNDQDALRELLTRMLG